MNRAVFLDKRILGDFGLPIKEFSRFVAAHKAKHKVKDFFCLDQFYVMAYAQLTGRQSLRDIEAMFQGIDLRGLGYRVSAHVATELATHIVLSR